MRILWIAPFFPPINVSASVRLLYYTNIASEMGHDCHVVTLDYPEDHISFDKNLGERIRSDVRVIRIPPGMLYKTSYPRRSTGFARQAGWADGLKRSFKSSFAIPDTLFESIRPAVRICSQLIKQNKYDIVFSAHEPPSAHLIAYWALRSYRDVRWVAYWSDPWTGDPQRRHLPYWRQRFERYLEEKVVHTADKLLFTSMMTLAEYCQTFGVDRSKCGIAQRGYNPAEMRALAMAPIPSGIVPGKVSFVYAGTIFKGLRDVVPFIDALEHLREYAPTVYDYLQVYFVGNIPDDAIRERLKHLSCVKVVGALPFQRAMAFVVHADVLLIWGNSNSGQIPGKLFEYFGATAPIFCILPDNANEPLKPLLLKADRGPLVSNNQGEIEEALIRTVGLIQESRAPSAWSKPVTVFEWNRVVQDLMTNF